jgi:hypothetical protein
MRAEELLNLLRRRPFVPIRLHLTDGSAHDIRHPEMALLSRSSIEIGIEGQNGGGIAEQIVYCSLLHIVRVENLSSQAGATS